MAFHRPLLWSPICATILLALSTASKASEWTEDSFTDFLDGTFFDAGSNLYVSAAGRIQIFNRCDHNNDGYPDIVMPSGHGHTEKEDTFVYFNNGSDIDGHTLMKVPANGSRDGLVHDFNKDGFNDLAVCNGDSGIHTRTNSYVYYGNSNGELTAAGRTILPSFDASQIAAGDFNADGWTDLAIACQWHAGDLRHPPGPLMSFVYWNGPNGFQADQRTAFTFGGQGARGVAAGDLDSDKRDDLIVLADKTYVYYGKAGAIGDESKRLEIPLPSTRATLGDVNGDGYRDLALCRDKAVNILLGSADGISSEKPIALEAESPSDVALADFDGDGRDDVAIANFAYPGGATWVNSYVYFSDGKDFSSRERTALKTLGATAVSAGDLNADGRPDLVFSNSNVWNQNSLPSSVYWNHNGNFRHGNHTQLETQGAVGNAIGDLNNDGRPDVVFFNFEGNFRDGPSQTTLYWGDGTRNFSRQRSHDFLSHYITGIAQADLDDNGWVDLVMTQGRSTGSELQEFVIPTIIEWSGPDGFEARSNLTIDTGLNGAKVADFNRDGYLDLILGAKVQHEKESKKSGMPIFWGSADGFSHHRKTLVPFGGEAGRAPVVTDLDRNGFLDLVAQQETGQCSIWWGAEDAFAQGRTTTIDLGREDALVFCQAADLNKDGWLDLILPSRQVGHDSETTSFIYFGSAQGYSNDTRTELQTYGAYEPCVADYDKDGWLDIFMPSYKGNVTRNWPSLIYWGSAKGFDERPPAKLPTLAAAGTDAADFDADGWIDLFIANHRIDGSIERPGPHNHRTDSMLYWGGPQGFSPANRLNIPSIGPHGLNSRDFGNSYDRGLYEDYVSSAQMVPQGERPERILWSAETPHGTSVAFQIRTAASKDGLGKAQWIGPNGADSWYTESDAAVEPLAGEWIQYRARLSTPTGGPTPYLTSVTIAFAAPPQK